MADRSAPPRRTPLWRRPLTIIVVILLMIIGWGGFEIFLALTARPGVTIDSHKKLEELVWAEHPGAGPSDDAWPLIEEIGGLIQQVRDKSQQRPGDEPAQLLTYDAIYLSTPEMMRHGYLRPPATLDPGRQHEILLAKAMASLTLLREKGVFERSARLSRAKIAVRPRGVGPVYEMVLSEIGTLRDLLRAELARMHVAFEAGDGDEAVVAFEHALGAMRLLGGQAVMIDRRAAINGTRDALAELRGRLAASELSPTTCRALMGALNRQVVLPPASAVIESVRVMSIDLIQWTHTAEGLGGGRRIITEVAKARGNWGLRGSEKAPLRIANLGSIMLPRKAEMVRRANGYLDDALAAAKLQGAARTRAFDALDARLTAMTRDDELLSMMLPRLGMVAELDDILRAELAATRIMLAIEIFRAEQGRLPATLAELSPSILPNLPADPYSPDGSFVYRPSGSTFVLYSVGPDSVDDGGKSTPLKKLERNLPVPKANNTDIPLDGRILDVEKDQ